MTLAHPATRDRLCPRAESAGLRVLAAASWPESPDDRVPPPIPGFVISTFSPLAAATAARCLTRAAGAVAAGAGPRPVTGVVVVSALGDLAGATHVAEVVDSGGRPGPLMFFQAVPNAVAGHVAVRWGLEGPVVCVADGGAGVDVAGVLIEDGDADLVLVVRVEQGVAGAADRAEAVLLAGGAGTSHSEEGEQP